MGQLLRECLSADLLSDRLELSMLAPESSNIRHRECTMLFRLLLLIMFQPLFLLRPILLPLNQLSTTTFEENIQVAPEWQES